MGENVKLQNIYSFSGAQKKTLVTTQNRIPNPKPPLQNFIF